MSLARVLLWSSLGSSILASPSAAAVYYISPAGSATNTGTSAAWPWSLSKANSSLIAGDVCYVLPGAYTGDIRPANSGSSNSSRISYVGAIATPSAATFSGNINLTARRYVTVKGVQAQSIDVGATSSTNRAEYDSVLFCRALGGLHVSGALRCYIVNNTIGDGVGDRWLMDKNPIRTTLCVFRNNVFNLGGVTAQPHVIQFDRSTLCEITNNRATITLPGNAMDVHGRIHYGIQNCTFRDNKWMLLNLTSYGNYVHNHRDSCRFNSFERDTVVQLPGSTNSAWIRFSTSGSFRVSSRNNIYTSCVFVAGHISYQHTVDRDEFHGSQFVALGGSTAFSMSSGDDFVSGPADSMKFRHCTFYSDGSRAMSLDANIVTNTRVTSCIFRAGSGTGCPIRTGSGVVADSNLVHRPGGNALTCMLPASSRWGDPMFSLTGGDQVRSQILGGLSPAPLSCQSGSPAMGGTWPDGYVGALGLAGPDLTPPAEVKNLATTPP